MSDNKQKNKPRFNDYVVYSTLGIEMAVVVFLGVWGGIELDKIVVLPIPLFKIVFPMLGIFAALYFLLRTIKNKK